MNESLTGLYRFISRTLRKRTHPPSPMEQLLNASDGRAALELEAAMADNRPYLREYKATPERTLYICLVPSSLRRGTLSQSLGQGKHVTVSIDCPTELRTSLTGSTATILTFPTAG